MSLREFSDGAGRTWRVWGTVPGTQHEADVFAQSARLQAAAERRATQREAEIARGVPPADAPRRSAVSPGREHGWLTFESGEEKRRLSPIPADWATASEPELRRLLARADVVHLSPAAAAMLSRHRRDAL
jgi:hypothetical protein